MRHISKHPLSLGMILFFQIAAVLTGSTDPSSLAEDKRVLMNIKKVLWPKAYREHDTVLLDKLLDSDFALIDSTGSWTGKLDELNYLKTKQPFPPSFNFHIKRLDIFENGTAIVAGIGEIRDKDEKGAYVFTYHSSNVLIKRNGSWKAVSSHTSGYQRVPASQYKGLPDTSYR